MDDCLMHHGIKGMKWGVRRYQNSDGSYTREGIRRYGVDNNRVLKKGTEVQNISKTKLSQNSAKSNRIYSSYTDSDKAEYLDMMGNFEYSQKGYKNTFKVKKDITIASEREVAKTFSEIAKDNPRQMSEMMAKAYNATHAPIIFKKNERSYKKQVKELLNDPDSEKSIKIARDILKNVPMTAKSSALANDFYTRMVKKGFDAVLDTNDAYSMGGTQDPLIIFNMSKLGDVKSVPLNEKDLSAAFDYTSSKEFSRSKKDYSKIAHFYKMEDKVESFIMHYGIKGMKWGVRRTPEQLGQKRNETIKNDRRAGLKNRRQLSDSELRSRVNRLKLEKEYASLAREDLHPGMKAVSDVLGAGGKKLLSSAVVGAVAYAGYSFMTKSFDWKTAAGYVFPNPNRKK